MQSSVLIRPCYTRASTSWQCPGSSEPSGQSSVPRSGRLWRSSLWQPCDSRLLRMIWKLSSNAWTCGTSADYYKQKNLKIKTQEFKQLTEQASHPWFWVQSGDTWEQMDASWGTGPRACLQESSPSWFCWTWCCRTTYVYRWLSAPSFLLKQIETVKIYRNNGC